jgi:hypothetical protein
MCSACSGNYCGDFEDHELLTEYGSVSKIDSVTAGAQPQETRTRGEALSSHKGARISLDSCSEDDYQILVSANRIVEIRTIAARPSPRTSLAGRPCGDHDRPLKQSEQSGFPTAKYYQTSDAVQFCSDQRTSALSILLIFRSLVVILLTALFIWLALR